MAGHKRNKKRLKDMKQKKKKNVKKKQKKKRNRTVNLVSRLDGVTFVLIISIPILFFIKNDCFDQSSSF